MRVRLEVHTESDEAEIELCFGFTLGLLAGSNGKGKCHFGGAAVPEAHHDRKSTRWQKEVESTSGTGPLS